VGEDCGGRQLSFGDRCLPLLTAITDFQQEMLFAKGNVNEKKSFDSFFESQKAWKFECFMRPVHGRRNRSQPSGRKSSVGGKEDQLLHRLLCL
jgi:hypothetical protein